MSVVGGIVIVTTKQSQQSRRKKNPMDICEYCEKAEAIRWDAYGDYRICAVCWNHQKFAVARNEGEFAS
jgi:hypothetical protein